MNFSRSLQARPRLIAGAGAVMVVLVSLALGSWFVLHTSAKTLQVDGESFLLEVAATERTQEQGLSGRTSLPANHGMLFVFSGTPRVECFWMKDMKFPLDITWLNASKQVVYMEQDISPSTYPHTFCPRVPVKYVIELNADTLARTDVHEGQTLRF